MKPIYTLEIRKLVLGVHLGCSADERSNAQDVSFSARFRFASIPAGANTDELSDSLCYAQVSDLILSTVTGREFKLIEHLGHVVFTNLKTLAGSDIRIELEVHKLNPPVMHLRDGSAFTISEIAKF